MADRSHDTELVHITTDDGVVLDGALWTPQAASHTSNPKLDHRLLDDIRDHAIGPAAHGFAGREDKVVAVTLGWLARIGLEPRRRRNRRETAVSN